MQLTDYPQFLRELTIFTHNFSRKTWLTKSIQNKHHATNRVYRIVLISNEVRSYQLSKTFYTEAERDEIFELINQEFIKSGNGEKALFYEFRNRPKVPESK